MIDHIAIDPQNSEKMFVAAWSVENQQAGDLFRSQDGGKTWETTPAMHGKSIRAMSLAASDSNVLSVGALDGVYRSKDAGKNWEKISSCQAEIKNIESIAIDPKRPDVIYAGTWHLAWKTADGGANWQHINKGMIDDSDVFSVIVDSSEFLRGLRQRLLGHLQERDRRRTCSRRFRAFRSRRAAPAC